MALGDGGGTQYLAESSRQVCHVMWFMCLSYLFLLQCGSIIFKNSCDLRIFPGCFLLEVFMLRVIMEVIKSC